MKKRILSCLIAVLLIFTLLIPNQSQAATIKLNKSKVSVVVGKTVQLKVTGTSKKAKWTTSDKKIATVSSNGKITAKYQGNVVITAKIGSKKYKCKVNCYVKDTKLTSEEIVDSLFNYDMAIGEKTTLENDSKYLVYSSYTDFEDTTLDQSNSFIKNGGSVYVCWSAKSAKSYISNLDISKENGLEKNYYIRFGNVVLKLSKDMSKEQRQAYVDALFSILTE